MTAVPSPREKTDIHVSDNDALITSILSADSCASKSLDHAAIDVALHRFPFSLVWSPIPILTWFLPFVGHLGIADSKG